MAAENLAGVSAALSRTFSRKLTNAWNREAILAQVIPIENESQGRGKEIAWDVAFSGATAGSYVEGSDVAGSEFNSDPLVPAVLPWGQYRAAFKLSTLEIAAAYNSIGNATELGNIVMQRASGALAKLASVINADMFSGTGLDGSSNPNIIGMATALSNTGTYAGISKSTYPEWAGNSLANGGTARPLTMDLLANAEQNIFQASGIEPDFVVTSAGVLRKYESLFETGKHIINDGSRPVMTYQGSTGPGFHGTATPLYWRGKKVLRDRNCPPGTLYMLNSNEIRIVPLPPPPGPAVDGVAMKEERLLSSNGQEINPTAISCAVFPLARTGSAVSFMAECFLQLKVARPNAHAALFDISES